MEPPVCAWIFETIDVQITASERMKVVVLVLITRVLNKFKRIIAVVVNDADVQQLTTRQADKQKVG